MSTRITKTTTL